MGNIRWGRQNFIYYLLVKMVNKIIIRNNTRKDSKSLIKNSPKILFEEKTLKG